MNPNIGYTSTLDGLGDESKELNLEDEYNDLVQSWEKLNSAVAKRKRALEHSYKVQVYLEECRTAVAFLKTRNELMTQYKITESLSG